MRLWSFAVYLVLIVLLVDRHMTDRSSGWILIMIGLVVAFWGAMKEWYDYD